MKPIDLISGVPSWEGQQILPGTIIRVQITREVPAAPRRRNFGSVAYRGSVDRMTPEGAALLKGLWNQETPEADVNDPKTLLAAVPEGGFPMKIVPPSLLASTMGDPPRAAPKGARTLPAGPPSFTTELITGPVLQDEADSNRRYLTSPQGAGRIYLQAGMMAEYVSSVGFEKTLNQLLKQNKITKAGYGPVDVLDTATGTRYLGVRLVLVNPTTVNIVPPTGGAIRMNPGWRLRDEGAVKGSVAPPAAAPAPTTAPSAPQAAPAPAPVQAAPPPPVQAAPAPSVADVPPLQAPTVDPNAARLDFLEDAIRDTQRKMNQILMMLLDDAEPVAPAAAPASTASKVPDNEIALGETGEGIE